MIFSYAWRSKLRNVEAWVAVRLLPGPNLLEHTVKKGEAFRNIVAWIGGAFYLSRFARTSLWSTILILFLSLLSQPMSHLLHFHLNAKSTFSSAGLWIQIGPNWTGLPWIWGRSEGRGYSARIWGVEERRGQESLERRRCSIDKTRNRSVPGQCIF